MAVAAPAWDCPPLQVHSRCVLKFPGEVAAIALLSSTLLVVLNVLRFHSRCRLSNTLLMCVAQKTELSIWSIENQSALYRYQGDFSAEASLLVCSAERIVVDSLERAGISLLSINASQKDRETCFVGGPYSPCSHV
jgi:hypothetical protein